MFNNDKNLRITVILIPIIYVLIWLTIIGMNYKAYGYLFSALDSNLVKLHTNLQVGTGPLHNLYNKKDINLLLKIYPNLSNYDIELIGNIPFDYVEDPAEIGDLIVYGNFKDSTDRYKNIGFSNVPVFQVKYYDYPSIIYGSKLYTYPIFLAILLLPLFIYVEIICLRKYKRFR